ncbi:MAG TPA: CaiB/BaiF CoA-transferase family protein, partial [Solirubrobacterales bacterium]
MQPPSAEMAAAEGPLAGVRVLDLSRLLPGGFCTALLGDMGADVVKIEQPGQGDYMRWGDPKFGAESAASWTIDRNKRSVSLDLKQPDGVAALLDLARGAQVIVESFRPGVVDRLGVGYEATSAVSPAIVYCSISGHGQDGPLRTTPGHDINYVGRAGILDISGPADGLPAVPGVQVADLGTGGLFSAAGILAALYRARETGEGDHIDISMTDGALAWLSIHLEDYFASGVAPGREGMILNGAYPCYNVYR